MVPYVRKSFWKHMLDGMTYIYQIPHEYHGGIEYNTHRLEIIEWVKKQKNNNASIGEGKEIDWRPVYNYALEMTEREIY